MQYQRLRRLPLLAKKIAQQVVAVLGQDRLRMELHALDCQHLVAQPHYFVETAILVQRPRGYLENRRYRLFFDDQRVIARRHERIRQTCEYTLAVVIDQRRLAVHDRTRAHDLAAIQLADALQPEAHAENRNMTSEP